MTIKMIEGFDYFNTTDPADNILTASGWSGSVDGMRMPANGAFGYGRTLQVGGINTNYTQVYRYCRGRHEDTQVWGMRMQVPPIGDAYFIVGVDVNSTTQNQWWLNFDQFGVIKYMDTRYGTVRYQTLPETFLPGQWFYIEVKWKPHATAGTFEIRINTVPVLSLTGIRTTMGNPIAPFVNRGITHISFAIDRLNASGGLWSNNFYIDDMYYLINGGADNNDYLGNVRAKYMALIGDDTPQDFVRVGAASNWQAASNQNMNDTAYVYSPTMGAVSLFTIDPNLNTPLVYGIEVSGAYRQDDATQRFITNRIKSGATAVDGDSHAINQTYTFWFDVYERNPDTGLQFTGAEVNALKVGPKIVT